MMKLSKENFKKVLHCLHFDLLHESKFICSLDKLVPVFCLILTDVSKILNFQNIAREIVNKNKDFKREFICDLEFSDILVKW